MDTISIERDGRLRVNSRSLREPTAGQHDLRSLTSEGVTISPLPSPEYAEILTPGAIRFLAVLSRRFATRRLALLQRRVTIQARLNTGMKPSFPADTDPVRNGAWRVAPIPADLEDRRVEITGPAADTKAVIDALNSGANIFVAGFGDAPSPTWESVLRGQLNLHRAVRRTLPFMHPEAKLNGPNPRVAVLMVRPRGWHLSEKHVIIDGNPVSASLFDFGLFLYHNGTELGARGSGPYFYLPKLESHLEARLWNDVFLFAQSQLGLSTGSIKATVLIENVLAAFEMEEILYELREHSAGLNCGRRDYVFSVIKKFHKDPSFVLPDRPVVTTDMGFLASCIRLLVATCHKRGAHAIGGSAARFPVDDTPAGNAAAASSIRDDMEREVREGHDGTWVACPALVGAAKEVFSKGFEGKSQLHVIPHHADVSAQDLLRIPKGQITENGLRTNINAGIYHIESWLRGTGTLPPDHLMESAATAEIARAQVWQWIHHGVKLSDNSPVTLERVRHLMLEELGHIHHHVGDRRFATGAFERASRVFDTLISSEEFTDSLTLAACEHIS